MASYFFVSILRFVRLLLSGHQAIAIENAALRLQLAAFQRKCKRPSLTTFDRVFWISLRRWWSGWRRPLLYVQADTVARWQRERFRRFWARRSKRHGRRRGRPATAVEIRRWIERMVVANPLWFAIIASARSRLTRNGLGTNNRSTCQPFSCLYFDSSDSC